MFPEFIEVNERRLFCVRHGTYAATTRLRVLIIPPFAEEMNKCRPLLARLARRLAEIGHICLIPDLYGTGDSSGDFGDANWSNWIADLVELDARFATQAPVARPVYLAVRTGAVLLAAMQERKAIPAGAEIVLWQPVLDGARFLQQFLRIRSMASRMAGVGESVAELQSRIRSGETVEVAGYAINDGLADGLGAAVVSEHSFAAAARVTLMEFKRGATGEVSQPSEQLAAGLRKRGVNIVTRVIDCDQFWATQEIALPSEPVLATVAALSDESERAQASNE